MNDSKFYIFTPAKYCSGGPEALHQLAYYLRKLGLKSYTVYYDYSGFHEENPAARYEQYEVETVKYEEIEDQPCNFVIAPENAPWCLNGFGKAQKCIWWLSVAYNNVVKGGVLESLVYAKRKMLGEKLDNYRKVAYNLCDCWHLCGSKYAYMEVRNRYHNSKVEYLVEPISLNFLRMGNTDLPTNREDLVLYNPSKPSRIMTELLERDRFKYVPLKGFTPEGLAEMYKKAKLYVDFGEFGGPERMPKEAVYFGCNILVANHNAAANDFDVAIPQKYKVEDGTPAEVFESVIGNMLARYEELNRDFVPFREKVERLEDNFLGHIQNVFCKDE